VAAARFADEALEGARRAGVASSLSNALVNVAIGRWALGEWDTVEGIVGSESLEVADVAVVAPVAALVLSARGRDPVEVVTGTPEVDETAFYLDLARAIALASSGDPRAVATVASAIEGAYGESAIYEDFTLFFGAALQIAAAFDDRGLFERLRRIVDDDGSTPPAGLSGHRALLDALDEGRAAADPKAVEASFVEALRHYQTWGSNVHTARAQAAYGAWLTRQGRLAEAEPLLNEARATYDALGAVAWIAELDRELSGVAT
jgi:hypothetical protein